ncbi:hypothetical protein KC19_VG040400 [Ceratodon purpureus]|uniref:Uncharacterized protein n=1 Tax=Ceratodon purpureus TaxID=3225 RepID=A0A8T0HM10_CERPU|nr:hypothetical protein KC19_VG040400 [Ceratodon purpureus]
MINTSTFLGPFFLHLLLSNSFFGRVAVPLPSHATTITYQTKQVHVNVTNWHSKLITFKCEFICNKGINTLTHANPLKNQSALFRSAFTSTKSGEGSNKALGSTHREQQNESVLNCHHLVLLSCGPPIRLSKHCRVVQLRNTRLEILIHLVEINSSLFLEQILGVHGFHTINVHHHLDFADCSQRLEL